MSGDRNDPDIDAVGTVVEEAAKLLGALSGWAKDTRHDLEDHLATGAPECTYCPICRTVHAVRELSPEVKDQLATAATSALQALAGLVSAAGAAGRGAPSHGVEHIDLDEGADDWPDEQTDAETDPESGPVTGPEEDDR